jgi:hypothetical protein
MRKLMALIRRKRDEATTPALRDFYARSLETARKRG